MYLKQLSVLLLIPCCQNGVFSQQMWFLCIRYLTSKHGNWIPNQADLGLTIASLWQVLHVFLKKLEPYWKSVKVPFLLSLCRYVCGPHFHTAALATILQWNDCTKLLNPRRGRSRPSQLLSPLNSQCYVDPTCAQSKTWAPPPMQRHLCPMHRAQLTQAPERLQIP